MSSFDLIVIGSGPGGYVAALRAAQLGAAVALVEARDLGGVCLNRGCIPTKTIQESAHLVARIRAAEKFGIRCGTPEVDYAAVTRRKDEVVARLRRGIEGLLERAKVQVVRGRGRILDPRTVEVAAADGRATRLEAKYLLIATGSEAARPSVFPFDSPRVVTSDEALELTQLPSSVLIIGGGYIGCELASMWAELGSRVAVVEMLPALLPEGDADVSKEMDRILRRRRVKVHVGTKIEKLTASPDGVAAELAAGKSLEADLALVAVGRTLNSDVEGLTRLGVEMRCDAIVVDDLCRTSVEGVSAVGDVTGRWMLAHYASHQGMTAAEYLFGGSPVPVDEHAVPSCLFTIPEVASVGLTEAEARKELTGVRVGRFDLAALGRAQVMGETTGFVKVIGDETGRVVGVHMVGPEVTSLIGEATLAVRLKMNMDDLVHTIHAHPTIPEALHEAALDFFTRAIHKPYLR